MKLFACCPDHPSGTANPCQACGSTRRGLESHLVHVPEILDRVRIIVADLCEAVRDRLSDTEVERLIAGLVNPEPAPTGIQLQSARGEKGIELRAIPLERPLWVQIDGDSVVVELGSHAGDATRAAGARRSDADALAAEAVGS